MLDRLLGMADEIDRERASFGLASAAAIGGRKTGPNPTDKGKSGSKRRVVVDRRGVVPLAMSHTAADVHGSKVLEEAVDAIEPIRKPGRDPRPRGRPKEPHTPTQGLRIRALPEGVQEEGWSLATPGKRCAKNLSVSREDERSDSTPWSCWSRARAMTSGPESLLRDS